MEAIAPSVESEEAVKGESLDTVVVFDADDFSIGQDCSHRGENYLLRLKEEVPQLKVTLFSIPAFCDERLIKEWGDLDWVELAVHGFNHSWAECEHWGADTAVEKLRIAESMGFVKGFKAPHWVTSPGLYAALMEEGWWLADHPRNVGLIPNGLPAYVLDTNHDIGDYNRWYDVIQAHCHTHDVCSNGVRERYVDLLALGCHDFRFVSEVVEPFKP